MYVTKLSATLCSLAQKKGRTPLERNDSCCMILNDSSYLSETFENTVYTQTMEELHFKNAAEKHLEIDTQNNP